MRAKTVYFKVKYDEDDRGAIGVEPVHKFDKGRNTLI
jgi:hypothetical protein